jgi:hypothetical protein
MSYESKLIKYLAHQKRRKQLGKEISNTKIPLYKIISFTEWIKLYWSSRFNHPPKLPLHTNKGGINSSKWYKVYLNNTHKVKKDHSN